MSLLPILIIVNIVQAVSSVTCPSHEQEQELNLRGRLGTQDLPNLEDIGSIVANFVGTSGINLILSDNNITSLKPETFAHPVFNNVTAFDFSSNNLKSLPNGLLDNFGCLRHLNLANNKLEDVSDGLLKNLTNLDQLNISYNSLRELPSHLFKTTRHLSRLYLSHNNISRIGHNTFYEGLSSLHIVDLSYNELKTFEPWPYIPNLGQRGKLQFDLSHNKISKFTNTMGWVKKRSYIDTLNVDLRFNLLVRFRKGMFEQYLQNQEITAYDIGDFTLNVTENPWYCDCGMYYFVKIANNSFYKELSRNFIKCNSPAYLDNKSLGDFFLHPDLLICNITENCPSGCNCEERPSHGHVVVNCSASGQYRSLPERIPSGNIFLDMSKNKIEVLTKRDYLRNVSVLVASHNAIVKIDDSFVEHIPNLGSIDVRYNKLTSLPSEFQRLPFEDVKFTDNSLECTCDTLWLNDWVRRNSQNLSSELASRLICSADGRESRLLDVTWTSLVCYRDIAIGVSIGLAFFLVFIIVTTVILWKYKYEFKVWMFQYLRLHPFDNSPCDNADDATKLYDVYLSIDRENDDLRMWVKDRLLKRLECKQRSHPAYRVYYPSRQDDFGDSIADQMVENINKSRRVLAVVNESYLRSGWAIEEFDHAHRLMEEAKSGRLLVLVKGDLDPSQVTQEPLKTYLTQKKCLFLSDKWVWQKLRYELPHNPFSQVTSASRESLTSGISSIHATLSESSISSYQLDDPEFLTIGVV